MKAHVFNYKRRKLLLVCCILSYLGNAQAPLVNGHSHNDYENDQPLFKALGHGFTSVEVDIYLIDGELYVSHDRPSDLTQVSTLEALYLDPLQKHIDKNKGKVYPGYNEFFYLMIDVKTDPDSTYSVLRSKLHEYESIISVIRNFNDQPDKPIKVFISGNRPVEQLLSDPIKYAGLDGRPKELKDKTPSAFMPVISDDFRRHMSWDGTGDIDSIELDQVARLISDAHDQGKKVRFWAAPDSPEAWEFLLSIGVDLINTDRIIEFREFAQENK